MFLPDDEALADPAVRRSAVARLLATAMLRLHARAALLGSDLTPAAPQNLPESAADCLASSPRAWLTVPAG